MRFRMKVRIDYKKKCIIGFGIVIQCLLIFFNVICICFFARTHLQSNTFLDEWSESVMKILNNFVNVLAKNIYITHTILL